MPVMPCTAPGLKPESSRPRARRLLLSALTACTLASAFALPRVSAQNTNARPQLAGPGTTPIITDGGTGDTTVPLPRGTLRVSTERFNNARNGVNNQETVLNPTNVVPSKFGKLFTRNVDALIYAQPLYVQNLSVTNSAGQTTTHNVVFVATANNTVYAFDADSMAGANSAPLWSVNFNSPGLGSGPTDAGDVTTVFGLPQADITPQIGITGTPVIDEATSTLYVVARTTEGTNYVHRLHALDIHTGQERAGSPALVGQYQDPITGIVQPTTVPGTGDNLFVQGGNSFVFFDLLNQNQRPALTLINGTLYIAYGAFDNSPPYHGWIFGYQTSNLLAKPTAFCTTPNNVADVGFFPHPTEGGIDMSGVGPATDGSSLYFTTGLGTAPGTPVGPGEYVQSVLKLPLSLNPSDASGGGFGFFRPNDYITLSDAGQDLGTGGVALLPDNAIPGHPFAMVTAGQDGKIYLIDRAAPGNAMNTEAGLISSLPNALDPTFPLLGANYGAPTVFTDSAGQVKIFFHAVGDAVRCFNVIPTYPFLQAYAYGSPAGSNTPINYSFPGAQTALSCKPDGSNSIVWDVEAVIPTDPVGGPLNQRPYAVLHAYNASPRNADGTPDTNNQLVELFNSNQKGGGINSIGDYNKFTQPLVVNGKVYVTAATPTDINPGGAPQFPGGRLVVFGLTTTQPGTTGQGVHYQLSGPVGFGGSIGGVELNRAYQYSLTAIDANNRPTAITGNVALSLVDQFFGNKYPLGSVAFNNQSYVVFTKTITVPGFFVMIAQDSNGNSSQNYPNVGDVPYIQAFGTTIQGFDHFTLRVPPTVRDGQLTNITIQAVSATGLPVAYSAGVTIYDTIPNGVQSFSPQPPVGNYAYEFQYGGFFPINAGSLIGITGQYPNINGNGTYPCRFNGPGQHVVVVMSSGIAVTGVVNVVGAAPGP